MARNDFLIYEKDREKEEKEIAAVEARKQQMMRPKQ
tara:strand:+ start:911 stop:1018 length:108 start_codon:yes stop_codon:yes gene_type:complete